MLLVLQVIHLLCYATGWNLNKEKHPCLCILKWKFNQRWTHQSPEGLQVQPPWPIHATPAGLSLSWPPQPTCSCSVACATTAEELSNPSEAAQFTRSLNHKTLTKPPLAPVPLHRQTALRHHLDRLIIYSRLDITLKKNTLQLVIVWPNTVALFCSGNFSLSWHRNSVSFLMSHERNWFKLVGVATGTGQWINTVVRICPLDIINVYDHASSSTVI